MLVANKKFDIRLYIVIKGVDPIEAYLFEDGLARFCTVSLITLLSYFKQNHGLESLAFSYLCG